MTQVRAMYSPRCLSRKQIRVPLSPFLTGNAEEAVNEEGKKEAEARERDLDTRASNARDVRYKVVSLL